MSLKDELAQPDLRTKAGALDFLKYKAPDDVTIEKHLLVNVAFQVMLEQIWEVIPEGPGKTVAMRSINRARMDCNSCIANHGA